MTLHFPGTAAPTSMRDVMTGAALTGKWQGNETVYSGLHMQPGQTLGYLAARDRITQAPREWLGLQRAWWSGTLAPPPAPPAYKPSGHVLDLSQDWSFEPLGLKDDAKAAVAADAHSWELKPLGMWNYPNHLDLTRGIAKKTFTVPAAWRGAGRIWWNFYDPNGVNFLPPYNAQVYLDGQPLWQSGNLYAMATMDLTDKLTPGPHTLAVVDQTDKPPVGPQVDSWVEFIPAPSVTQDLSGQWAQSSDGLTYAAPVQVPGSNPPFLQRTFTTDPKGAGDNVFVYVEGAGNLITVDGVIVNGHFLGHDAPRGAVFQINLTPWLHRDAPNTITLVHSWQPLKTVELRYYAPGAYP